MGLAVPNDAAVNEAVGYFALSLAAVKRMTMRLRVLGVSITNYHSVTAPLLMHCFPLPTAQLFTWEWNKADAEALRESDPSERAWSPIVVHKTRRSLRAVHFHPHGAPLMLTAEVRTAEQRNIITHPVWHVVKLASQQ